MSFDVSHPERLPTQAEYKALSETDREVLFQSTLTFADSITFVTHEKVGQPFTYDEYCRAAERERAHRNKMAAGSPQGSTAYFGDVDRYRRSLDSFPSVEDAFQRAKSFQIDLYDKGLAHVDGLLKKNAEGVSDLNVYLFAACVQGYFASGPDQAKANLREVLEFYGSDQTGSNIATQAIELWSLYRGKILDHLSQDDTLILKKYFAQKGASGVLQDPSLQEMDETTQAVLSALQKNVPTFVDQLVAVETSATFQDYGRVVFTDMHAVLVSEKNETQFGHGSWWHLYDFMLNYNTPEAKREFCRQVGISVEAMNRALAGEAAPESASPKEKEFAASMQKARWEHKGHELYCAGVKLVICIGLGIAAGYALGPAMGGIAAASGSAAGGAFDVAEVRGRRDRARAQVVSDLEDTGVGSEVYVASLETEVKYAYGAALTSTTLSAGTGAIVFEGGPLVAGAMEFGKNHLEADVTGALDGRLTDLEYNNERRQLEGNETPYDSTDAVTGVVTNATVAAVFGGVMTVGMQAAPHLASGFKTKSVPRVEVPLEAANNNDSFREISFSNLPPERQSSLRDMDAAYKNTGDEESLVVMPDGDVIPVPGKADRAHSTAVKGEQGDGTVQRGRLLAHSQSDTIVPSAEDCRVFLAQAKDRPGEEFVTQITAHSKTPGGDPELLEVRIKYDPATQSFDVQAKATQASMVELDQVDVAFEKAKKDFAKLSLNAQESARADMAAAGNHNEIFAKHPKLEIAIKSAGLTLEQGDRLLAVIAEKTGKNVHIFEELPRVLDDATKTGLSPEQIVTLLGQIAEKTGEHAFKAFRALPMVLDEAAKTGLSPEQIVIFLRQIAEKTALHDYDVSFAFYALPDALKAKLSPEQIVTLFGQIAEKTGEFASNVFTVLPDALKAKLSPEQIVTLFGQIAEIDLKMMGVSNHYLLFRVAIPVALETKLPPEQIVILFGQIAEKVGKNATDDFFHALPKVLHEATIIGLSLEQIVILFGQIAEKAKGDTEIAISFLPSLMKGLGQAGWNDQQSRLYLRLLDCLNDYNRASVLYLLRNNAELYTVLGPEHFPAHFELYVTIFERWPRLGYAILEGVLDASKSGIIPRNISTEQNDIFTFIDKTNGFVPVIYAEYKKAPDKDSFIAGLKTVSQKIITDSLSLEEANQIITQRSEDFLLAVIQMASPTSGASFVGKDEQLGLMKKMLEAGDLRHHVPEAWRGQVKTFEMTQGAWKIKEGQIADSEGHIKNLLSQFRSGDGDANGQPEIKEQQLVESLKTYLAASSPEAKAQTRAEVLKTLYQLAGQNDALKEKIDRIQDGDYSSLMLLEQLFGDKDNLQKMLAEAFEKVPEELLIGKGEKKAIEGDAKQLVKGLKAAWGKTNLSEERRLEIVGSILKAYQAEDIESKILSRTDIDESLKEAINTVMHQAPALNTKRLIVEILQQPTELIQNEKSKYDYQDAGSMILGLRPAKGPAFGLNGLSSGVCTATDMEFWKNPAFKLFAITDEKKGQVVGYIHVFEIIIDGKKYLTLPGINPSAEFLGTVDAKKLYASMMEPVIEFAKTGGYEGLYIPTTQNIHSNRADIHTAIVKSKYPTKHIPQVDWNTTPSPYPFTEVYAVWEAG